VRLSVFDSYCDTIVIVISKLLSTMTVIVLLSLSSTTCVIEATASDEIFITGRQIKLTHIYEEIKHGN